MKNVFNSFLILTTVLLSVTAVFAGGPLSTRNGNPVIHDKSTFPIVYTVDPGRLGTLDNTEATALVDECFSKWEDVPTASIRFENGGYLPVDVDETNYGAYWTSNDGINPIVFDDDGSIMEAVYGMGGSDSVLGFASFSSGAYIGEGFVVLNGKFSEVPGNPGVLKATIVHELGHFLGLDHTQINTGYAQNDILTDDRYVPTMFPFQTDNDTSVAELNPDDKAALTLLYPVDPDSVYGKISGTVKRGDGSPVFGANVTAVMIGKEDMNQFSSVSDYYRQADGAFEMYVLPGTYKVFIEPINRAFTGGSSVGPYSETLLFGASFIDPVKKEYYNGIDESSSELDLKAYTEITVLAGEEVSGIDFIADEDFSGDLYCFFLEIIYNLIPVICSGAEMPGQFSGSLADFLQMLIYFLMM